MDGQFIVLEGLEGAGKSSAVNLIQEILSQAGIEKIKTVREPGGTLWAEKIRELIKAKCAEKIDPRAEALLMFAARVQLVETVIKPALSAGYWVIGDRHSLSTRAYQGGGRGLDDQWLLAMEHLLLPDFSYDFCIYLDVDPKLGLQRIARRNKLDRFESEELEFFQRVRARYLEIIQNAPAVVNIDSANPLPKVREQIAAALKARYSLTCLP